MIISMLNKEVVYAKIETIRHCLLRIEEKTPKSAFNLMESYDLQDIIAINLERAVQGCVDIATHIIANSECGVPDSMGRAFLMLEELNYIDHHLSESMIASVGFRNIVVHAYREIDWNIVFTIITEHVTDFKQFIIQVLAKIDE